MTKSIRVVLFEWVSAGDENHLIRIIRNELYRGITHSERVEAKKLIAALQSVPRPPTPVGIVIFTAWSGMKGSRNLNTYLTDNKTTAAEEFRTRHIEVFNDALRTLKWPTMSGEQIQSVYERLRNLIQ